MTQNPGNKGFEEESLPDGAEASIGLVVSEWNSTITHNLAEGATNLLTKSGVLPKNLHILYVPGSYELIAGAQIILNHKEVGSVICLGCVIRGETSHFDFICQAVSQGLANLTIRYAKPVIFGVLTTENMEQALDRSGGKLGNKGEEAAYTALKMIDIKEKFLNNR